MQAISPIQRTIYKLHVGGQCCMDLKLSATNISTTDNLVKFCILLAIVNVYPKKF